MIILQDDINALFYTTEKTSGTDTIETLTIPDRKEMVEAIPSLIQRREQLPQPAPSPVQPAIQPITTTDKEDTNALENGEILPLTSINPSPVDAALPVEAPATEATTEATMQEPVVTDETTPRPPKPMPSTMAQNKPGTAADDPGTESPATKQVTTQDNSIQADTPTDTEHRQGTSITGKKVVTTATPTLKSSKIHDAAWLLKQKSSSFTLQLFATRNLHNTQKFLDNNRLPHGNASVYKAQRKQRELYILLYGIYPNKTSAQQAITRLPASVRKLKPWIRPLSPIQQEISKSGL
jgi:DamX protein